MGKLPYIQELELFVRCDFKHAEEKRAEYVDFYYYNLAQYKNLYHTPLDVTFACDPSNNETEDQRLFDRAEHNAKVAADHFEQLLGSRDFYESVLVGFTPAWEDVQKILLEEYRQQTAIKDSSLNYIGRYLRRVASTVLFAEKIVSGLEKFDVNPDFVTKVKERFVQLVEDCKDSETKVPEFFKHKSAITKFKKPEQYLEFCDKIIFGGK